MKKILLICAIGVMIVISILIANCIFTNASNTETEEKTTEELTLSIDREEDFSMNTTPSPVDNMSEFVTYSIPNNSGFKSYMPYNTITSKISNQYKLQQIAYTGKHGIRMVNDRYCIALGTHFNADIGTYVDLILANETVISCVVADIKADQHTDKNNIITVASGCVSEFIVDAKAMNENAKKMGDMSFCEDKWQSKVVQIRVYDVNVFKGE